MGLMQQAQADIRNILQNSSEFGSEITITTNDGLYTVTLIGLAIKHHTNINDLGQIINSKVARVTFSENSLANFIVAQNGNNYVTQSGDSYIVENSYPVRNSAGNVDLNKALVSFRDSSNKLCYYTIRQWYPDEVIGMIVCMLDVKK